MGLLTGWVGMLSVPVVRAEQLVWLNACGDGVWDAAALNWSGEEGWCAYRDGVEVLMGDEGAGLVLLRDQVAPGSVCVDLSAGVSYTWSGLGGVAGEGMLRKLGEGSLEILTRNSYSGGTVISGGMLMAGQSTALGSGTVWLESGVLSLEGCEVSNRVVASGGELRGAQHYAGEMHVAGEVRLEGELRAGALVLESGSLSGGSVWDTAIRAAGGSISAGICGASVLIIESDLELGAGNSYTGGTEIVSGRVEVLGADAFGTGCVTLSGGTLDLGHEAVDNVMRVTGTSALTQAEAYAGSLVLESGTLTVMGDVGGELVLDGGCLDVSANAWGWTVGSLVSGDGVTQLYVGELDGCRTGQSYTLVEMGAASCVDVSRLELLGASDGRRYVLEVQGNSLVVTVQFREPTVLRWDASQSRWGLREEGDPWESEVEDRWYMDGDTVLFASSDVVEIVGEVRPGMIRVEGEADVTLTGQGCIAGAGALVKTGSGTLVVEGAQAYAGGTLLEGGGLRVADAGALGSGEVYVHGGVLDLGGLAVVNGLEATAGVLCGMEAYEGELVIAGDVVLAGETHAGSVLLQSGSLEGGCLSDVVMRASGGCVASRVSGCSTLTVLGDVVLCGANDYTGETRVAEGSLTVEHAAALGLSVVWLDGGVLDLAGWAVENELRATGGRLRGAEAYAGVLAIEGELELEGTLRAQRVELKGGSLAGGCVVDTEVLAVSGVLASRVSGSSRVVVSGEVGLVGDNDYTGGTVVNAGTLRLGDASALGSGCVALHGGELDLGGLAVENAIGADGGFVSGGEAYAGVLTVEGGVVGVAEGFTARQIVLEDGALAGVGIVDTEVLVEGGRLEAPLLGSSSVCVMGDAELCGGGDYEGGTLLVAGTLRAGCADALGTGTVTVQGGSLDLAQEIVFNRLVLQGGSLAGAERYRGDMVVEGDVRLEGDATALSLELHSGTLSGGLLSQAAVTLLGGRLETMLGAGCSLTVAGDVCLAGENALAQDVVLLEGRLTVEHAEGLGSGCLRAQSGVLSLQGWALANDVVVTGEVSLLGAEACTGTLSLLAGATLHLTGAWGGELLLDGGTLDVSANGCGTSLGSLCTGELGSVLDVGDLSGLVPGGSYTLLQLGDGTGLDVSRLEVLGTECLPGYALELVGNELMLRVDTRVDAELVWDPSGRVWGEGMQGDAWCEGEGRGYFMQGNTVVFDQADEVSIVGVVRPSCVRVTGEGEVVWRGEGSLSGSGSLVMEGEGTLAIWTANGYSGGTVLEGGTLQVRHASALGTGEVSLLAGCLDMGGLELGNRLVVSGAVEVLASECYQGELVLESGVLRGDRFRLEQAAEVRDGVVESALCGTAGLVKTTAGMVTLLAANAYSGTTRVLEGTLVLGDVAALGTGDVEVGEADAVEVAQVGEPAILDAAGLPLANRVTLYQGALLRGGSCVASVTLAPGAAVTLEDYALQRGCTLAAAGGNTVAGSVCFAGGTLALDGTGLVFTGECRVEPGSTTVLDVSALAGDFSVAGSHTLMVCEQGVTGATGTSFAIAGLDSVFASELVYDAVTGSLVLVTEGSQQLPPALDPTYYAVAPSLLNANQRSLYVQLRSLARTVNGGAALGGVAKQVTDETDVAAVKVMLDQLGGFSLATLMQGLVDRDLAHVRRVRDAMGAEAAPVNRSGSFLAYVNSFANGEQREDAVEAPGYEHDAYGAMLGVEWRASETWLWGLALEEGVSTLTSAHALEAQTASTTLDCYACVRGRNWKSHSILGVSFSETDVDRVGLDGVASAKGVEAMALHLSQEVSYDFPVWRGSSLQPYMAVDAGYYRMGGMRESGLGELSLRVEKQEAWAVDVSLGLRWCCTFGLGRWVPKVALTAHAGVVMGWGDGGERLRVSMLGAPGYAYHVEGQRRERVGATAGVDFRVPVGRKSELYVGAAVLKREEGEQLDVRVGWSRFF